MSELEESTNYKNQLDRITLTKEQSKELNAILTNKDLTNDYKYEQIRKFRGTCSVHNNEPSFYALFDGNDGQVLERYCQECFDKLPLK